MGRQPAWILRWGITVLILILTGIIVACYFIKYPQTVTAAVTLTSDNPPSDLVAKYTGTLDSVYVNDGASVRKGQLLALVANAANYGDVIRAEAFLADSTAATSPPLLVRIPQLVQAKFLVYCQYRNLCEGSVFFVPSQVCNS